MKKQDLFVVLALVSVAAEITYVVQMRNIAKHLKEKNDRFYDEIELTDPELAETMRNKFAR